MPGIDGVGRPLGEMDALADRLKRGEIDLSTVDLPPIPGPPTPRVGAAAFDARGRLLEVAHRGEDPNHPGRHAEFNLLRKIRNKALRGGTLYTSLEPCTPNTRSSKKTACVLRIIEARPKRVLVGMLDPNKEIRGTGIYMLQKAEIDVGLFEASNLRALNKEFVAHYDKMHHIGDVALRSLYKISHSLWLEASTRYNREPEGAPKIAALNRSAEAARCFNWAEAWLARRSQLTGRAPETLERGGLPHNVDGDPSWISSLSRKAT